MAADCQTLGQFLNDAQVAGALSAAVSALVLDLATACREISERLSDNVLRAGHGRSIGPGAASHAANATFLVVNDDSVPTTAGRRDWSARMISTWQENSESTACGLQRGRHLAVLLPVDSPANLDLNATVGTIFSVLETRLPRSSGDIGEILRGQATPLCTGYAIHGPSLILVVAFASGVQAFAYDRQKDEFVLTHADMRIPAATTNIAVDASEMRSPELSLRRYLDECLAGTAGPRGRDFRFRWCGSMVTEVHRILMQGGVLIWPGAASVVIHRRRLRLLEEVNPLSHIIERAGGRTSTGVDRIVDAAAGGVRLQESLVFGAAEEVERIEAYHRDPDAGPRDTPLFGARGLFRPAV